MGILMIVCLKLKQPFNSQIMWWIQKISEFRNSEKHQYGKDLIKAPELSEHSRMLESVHDE